MRCRDRAGEIYWDRKWEKGGLPPALDPCGRGLNNYVSRKFHGYFERVFRSYPTHGRKLLEIGCAQSVYLPYFSKYFGFQVAGLDRSEIGCDKARMILDRESVTGQVYCADFFSPPHELLEEFDVVVSFGVVEHFQPTVEAIQGISKMLKPKGKMVTIIPNLVGILGPLQKVLDVTVYDAHVPLDRQGLASAHAEAGLEVESCEYFLPVNLGVLDIENWAKKLPYKITVRLRSWISKLFWLVEDHFGFPRGNRFSSPYINCVAQKPCA